MKTTPRTYPYAQARSNERGQAIVLVVVTLAVLLGAAAIVIDVGYAYFAQRSLQAQADAAALAGAGGLPNTSQAQTLAQQYGGSTGSKNRRANLPNVDTTVTLKCIGSAGCTTMNAVQVVEHATVNSFFARVLGRQVFDVRAKATACSPGTGSASLVDDSSTTCPLTPPGPCVLGYPFKSSNARTNLQFNESEVLRAFAPNLAGSNDTIKVWYNDEHTLTLGVRQVQIKTGNKSSPVITSTNYAVAPLSSVPSSSYYPAVGSTYLTGEQAGVDVSDRPMFPALFVTDLTDDLSSRSGDWQFFGTPIPPSAVFGTWKGAVKVINKTVSPAVTTVTPDADSAKNNWNLSSGSDTPPAGLTNEGFGAEARWKVSDLNLQPNRIYRLQFMVHDGDQHGTGGDVGEACMHVVSGA